MPQHQAEVEGVPLPLAHAHVCVLPAVAVGDHPNCLRLHGCRCGHRVSCRSCWRRQSDLVLLALGHVAALLPAWQQVLLAQQPLARRRPAVAVRGCLVTAAAWQIGICQVSADGQAYSSHSSSCNDGIPSCGLPCHAIGIALGCGCARVSSGKLCLRARRSRSRLLVVWRGRRWKCAGR